MDMKNVYIVVTVTVKQPNMQAFAKGLHCFLLRDISTWTSYSSQSQCALILTFCS